MAVSHAADRAASRQAEGCFGRSSNAIRLRAMPQAAGLLHRAPPLGGDTWFERALDQPEPGPAYAQLAACWSAVFRRASSIHMPLLSRGPTRWPASRFPGTAELSSADASALDHLQRAARCIRPSRARWCSWPLRRWRGSSAARSTLGRIQQALPYLTGDKVVERFFGATPSAGRGCAKAAPRSPDPIRSPPLPPLPARGRGQASNHHGAAVLPFHLRRSGGSLQPIADVITEDLTNSLSRVGCCA